MIQPKFNNLEDYLTSMPLNLNGSLDDGWGALLPAKGREIDATILFADISGFSARTRDLTPAETLIFVNHFFAWMTAEGLQAGHGIIDKYIGDEMMIVFAKEFGSDDPFAEALTAARRMGDFDAYAYCPHVGVASGRVIVGYVGTPRRYNCSVFGAPVALAARCAGVKIELAEDDIYSATAVFPAAEWGSRDFDAMFPPMKMRDPTGAVTEYPHAWRLHPPRTVDMKNLPPIEVREMVNHGRSFPMRGPEEWAKGAVELLRKSGLFLPPVASRPMIEKDG